MNRSLKKPVIIFIIMIAVISVLWVVVQYINNTKGSSDYIRDRDTGEIYDSKDTASTGGGFVDSSDKSNVVTFGIKSLLDNDVIKQYPYKDFTNDIIKAIGKFSTISLGGKYKSITLVPEDITFDDIYHIQGKLRLGQGETFTPIDVRVYGEGKTAIIQIGGDHKNKSENFIFIGHIDNVDEYLFDIYQAQYTDTSVTINTYTYREAALDYLKNLGYNIPDLNITFTNYKDPFK